MGESKFLYLQDVCIYNIEDYKKMFEILTERDYFFDWIYDYIDENPNDKRVIKFIKDIS